MALVKKMAVISIVLNTGLNVRVMFAQYYFALPLSHNILHLFFASTFYCFTCSHFLIGDITGITNYDYDKYLSIPA